MTLKFLLPLVLILASFNAIAQEETEEKDYFSLSLEELMNIPIGVASKTELPIRESPGIISVITEQEIKNSGARDLIDVLSLVPGMHFGTDVQGTVGIGIRGNWGYEGKILLLLDGQMMNETMFATVGLGNHFDVNTIDRIEIIRGPGSSIYGGFAELGVINIITKSGKKLSGGNVTTSYGALDGTYGRRLASVAVGNGNDDVEYSVKGFFSQGNRSEKDFTDYTGTTINLADVNTLNTTQLNAGLRIKKISARLIYDKYQYETRVWLDEVLPEAASMDFTSLNGELKYDATIGEKFTLTPKINFNFQQPWFTEEESLPYDVKSSRINANLNSVYKPNEKVEIVAGFDSYFDHATSNLDSPDPHFVINGKDEVDFNNLAAYAQARFITSILNITLGARVDNHSEFGSAFSPRIGFTKTLDKLHFKLLYSRAFRAPSIENMNYAAGELEPERTGVAEFEVGYLLGDKMTLTANLFDITIDDPIVYFVSTDGEGYGNFSQAGSRGVEVEYKVKDKWGYLTVNYSFYSSENKNEVSLYEVPQNSKQVLAFPSSRVNVYASFRAGKNFSINPSASLLGKRYAYNDVSDATNVGEIGSSAKINLFLNYTNFLTKNLTLGAGVWDAFDEGSLFIQPYNGGLLPMPGTGREFVIKLGYDFTW